ncbi:unnamed protein product [Rotaria socialis]|uniref:Ubiquitin-protein ligase E3C n=2 Tax=Rotaria socialis TaxID=392032 RepID=A0A820W883_9BILA|nr:unnamed protein product [Rotaria socialis]CAF4513396.1 unnamed protein product [Rotaria socialis]CAF4533091.1 unnamed protein product [Rotaria socialis]
MELDIELFFQMHSFLFVGNHKSHPAQDYSRTSNINTRDDFIKRAEQDREKRELTRKQLYSAIKIQTFYRRILAQKRLRRLARERISNLLIQLQSSSFDEENLVHLANLIDFGFKPSADAPLMMSLIESCWKHRIAIMEKLSIGNLSLKIAIAKLLKYAVRCLSNFESIRLPTRFIEWFTDIKSYTNENVVISQNLNVLTSYFLRNIILSGYYTQMCSVIQSKVPADVSKTSRIPAIETIVELLARPIEYQLLDSSVRDEALNALRNELFSRSDLAGLPLIITPTLVHRANFPAIRYIELIDFNPTFPTDSFSYKKWKLYQLHAFLLIIDSRIDKLPISLTRKIVTVIRYFIDVLITRRSLNKLPISVNDIDEEDTNEQMDVESEARDEPDCELIEDCLSILNKRTITNYCIQLTNLKDQTLTENNSEYIANLAAIAHSMILFHQYESILRSNFLMTLSTSPVFLAHLWTVCRNLKYQTDYRENVFLLSHISCASSSLKDIDIDRIESLLVTFGSLYSMSLVPLHDDEFFLGPPHTAFQMNEISDMVRTLRDVCMGIVRFMYPDKQISMQSTNTTIGTNDDKESQTKANRTQKQVELAQKRASKFSMIFKIIVQLLQQIRSRDVRRRFCPQENWLTNQCPLNLDKIYLLPLTRGLSDPSLLSFGNHSNLDQTPDAFPFSVTELRVLTVLKQIPFVIPFDKRVQVFNMLIHQNKSEQQVGADFLQSGSSVNIRVRRGYIYEDAFDKLSPQNEPNLRRKFRVSFINAAGLDEAGIDGGGLFREFMNELLKTSFNPIRGLFKLTSDGYLYPNPNVAFIDENFGPHYYFLGRMLGKAIYEKFLAELPFATFFLQKILSRSSGKVDIDHLASLDPEMYKNLLYLKNYTGNVEDLGLDFTIVNSEIGQTQVIELKANGRNTAVTEENRIEYIHLVANYKLNKQINEQVLKFRQGLSDVIDLEWLRMFDANELRILISGAPGEIDVDDWKNFCQYKPPYNKEHPIIQAFWKCVSEFTEDQKRKLLKFTTSCSRPPLFGFKELYPEFSIQSAGSEIDRLPTSNTCINLLKLPEYQDGNMLKEKLLYAIQAAAGFEFS